MLTTKWERSKFSGDVRWLAPMTNCTSGRRALQITWLPVFIGSYFLSDIKREANPTPERHWWVKGAAATHGVHLICHAPAAVFRLPAQMKLITPACERVISTYIAYQIAPYALQLYLHIVRRQILNWLQTRPIQRNPTTLQHCLRWALHCQNVRIKQEK